MSITLEVISGPLNGKSFSFDRHSTFLVGRSTDAQFSLPADEFLSRNHFLVELNPPLAKLMDLGSRNGTLVNRVKVKEAMLKDGDLVEVGTTRMLVRLPIAVPDVTRDLPARNESVRLPSSIPTVTRDLPATNESDLPSSLPTITQSPTPRKAAEREIEGQLIGDYRVERWLAGGGMGDVYRVVRPSDGKVFALKTIKPAIAPTGDMITRFLREADILRRLRHQNIISFEILGESNGKLYFVMEFVSGGDAASLVKSTRQAGQLPKVPEVLRIAKGLLAGLEHAHLAGFVHRDIKPGNVLVGDDGSVKLADFGLGRVWQDSPLSGLTMSGQSSGTPAYMPPEQIRDFRSVKPAGDQYSAAATIYCLLTGELPFGSKHQHVDLIRKILNEAPTPITNHREDLPSGVVKALNRGMAKRAEDRFSNIADFAKALGIN